MKTVAISEPNTSGCRRELDNAAETRGQGIAEPRWDSMAWGVGRSSGGNRRIVPGQRDRFRRPAVDGRSGLPRLPDAAGVIIEGLEIPCAN